ncbi:MAG: Demethylmenaquinone methyltransferase [Chlamydiae bacterium]|nr:Demethylmenaquinone methyltransferase [Chlamydiota bacterium]
MKEQRNYSIFSSHLDLAHSFWEKGLASGGWAIDATCGNGHDTLRLSRLVGPNGGVIGLDIQKEALESTKALLKENQKEEGVHLFHQSHEEFPPLANENPVQLIVYNLGYLPGGNKALTTRVASTLSSVEKALALLSPGGTVSLTCYPGHPEGEKEESALLDYSQSLLAPDWSVSFHRFLNRRKAPSLLVIQKNIY